MKFMRKLNISCWNVRALIDNPESSSPARRTALICKELDRYNVDIATLSETRLADDGQIQEIASGYTIFRKGRPSRERREAGVGFAIRSNIASKLHELPRGINDRLMTLRLHLHGNRHATIISAYAPALVSDEEEKQRFYDNLRDVLQAVPKGDKIVSTGDFNPRVGKDWQTWDSLERHGVGSMNGNGQLLLQLCTEFNLFISSTHFCHKGDHLTTWMHPRSRQWHLLDYVIVRQRDMQDVYNVHTLRGANCWTDHALVRAKFRMVIKPAARLRTTVKLPKRLDLSKLHSAEFQEALAEGMNAVAYTSSWDATKDDLYKVAEETVGTVAAKRQDWFDENDQAISDVLAAKNNIRSRMMQKDLSKDQERQLSEALKQAKADAQGKLRSMQEAWWSNLAAEMQAAADMKNSKELYNLTKQAFGPKTARITPLRSKDGKEVHNTMEKSPTGGKNIFRSC